MAMRANKFAAMRGLHKAAKLGSASGQGTPSGASDASTGAASSAELSGPGTPASDSAGLSSSASSPRFGSSANASSPNMSRSPSAAAGFLPPLTPPPPPAPVVQRPRQGRRRSSSRVDQGRVAVEAVREMMKGESEGVIAATTRRLKLDPRYNPRSPPSSELLADIQEIVKIDLYGGALQAIMPPCFFACRSFVAEMLKRVVRPRSPKELEDIIDGHRVDVYFMWHDVLKGALVESDKFSCPICMEAFVQIPQEDHMIDVDGVSALSEWTPTLRKTEHWSSNPCGHVICRTCMRSWAEAEIEQQRSRIKCPAVGCSHVLWDHDVEELVSRQALSRYKALKSTDHLKKMREDLKDPVLGSWLKKNARPCPDCHIIVSRSEGCNAMRCVCGTAFCYRCGFKECACGKSKNGKDIWNPDA